MASNLLLISMQGSSRNGCMSIIIHPMYVIILPQIALFTSISICIRCCSIECKSQRKYRRGSLCKNNDPNATLFRFYTIRRLMPLQFEYINPLVGLAMFIIGLFLTVFGYFEYGIIPVIVGLFLVG